MLEVTTTIITFIVSTILTAIAYLIVPTFFCAIGYSKNLSYSLKTIKRIVLINGASVWLTLQIISISLGEFGVSAAVFIWSGLAYWLMRKILYKKSAEPEKDNKIEFEIVNKNDKKKNLKAPFAIVAILLSLSVALNFVLLVVNFITEDNTEFEQELEQAEEQNRKLEQELQQGREKLDFFDEHIVMIEDDNTNLYHKYECYRFKGNDFWVYNVENAEYLGYDPCPNCCKS